MSDGELASLLEEQSPEETVAVLFPDFGLVSRSFGRWKLRVASRSSRAPVEKEAAPQPSSVDMMSRLQDAIERRSLIRQIETQRELNILSHARLCQIRWEIDRRTAGTPASVRTFEPYQPAGLAGSWY
jgi:hypothetical protein